MKLDLEWVDQVQVNLSAVQRRTATLTKRRSVKKDEKIPYIDFVKSHNDKNTIKLFEETGHYITIEKPKVVNEIIQNWLNNL